MSTGFTSPAVLLALLTSLELASATTWNRAMALPFTPAPARQVGAPSSFLEIIAPAFTLDEELRLQVVVGDALAAAVENDADGGGLRLTVYASRPADAVDPRPEPVDGTHDRIRWVHGSELETLELAPLDRPFVAAVRAFLDAPDDHLS